MILYIFLYLTRYPRPLHHGCRCRVILQPKLGSEQLRATMVAFYESAAARLAQAHGYLASRLADGITARACPS